MTEKFIFTAPLPYCAQESKPDFSSSYPAHLCLLRSLIAASEGQCLADVRHPVEQHHSARRRTIQQLDAMIVAAERQDGAVRFALDARFAPLIEEPFDPSGNDASVKAEPTRHHALRLYVREA